jgi:selenocysteine lyase/cysteine desulfurase
MAGGGDFYAARPLAAMNVNPDHGVLRLSFVHYTSDADIVKLIDALGAHL